jgi:hypothetical protein
MANVLAVWGQALDFFQRNNPVETMVQQAIGLFYTLKNMPSQRKLTKYKYLLELERFEAMESALSQGTPYDPRGINFDRPY